MKLYTEEQVKTAIKDAYSSGIERPVDFKIVDESIMNFLTPIQLPSYEEIEKEALKESSLESTNMQMFARLYMIHGAKWMRDKILNNG